MLPAHPNELAPEAPRRRFRKLRIAWSVAWGIVCVLLIVLWRASYHSHATTEPYAISGTSDLTIEFYHGQVALILSPQLPPNTLPLFLHDYPVQNENRLPGIAGFASLRVPRIGDVAMAPFWFVLLLAITTGAVPWFRWQFSLRTLLIATTLVAVGLGLIVWMR